MEITRWNRGWRYLNAIPLSFTFHDTIDGRLLTATRQSLLKETQVYRLARKRVGPPELVCGRWLRDDHKHPVEIQLANDFMILSVSTPTFRL